MYKGKLRRISLLEELKVYLSALFLGSWVLLKRLATQLWKRSTSTDELRGNPPECLTDTSLGQHSYVKLKRVKLHYVECGDKKQPLALLLHGFPDCWITWRNQMSELSKHYRVVALDLKGFGDSDKPEGIKNYNLTKILEELKEVIVKLGHKSCTLVGHDLGALLGWYFVYFYPDMVGKFVALAAPHPNLYWSTVKTSSKFNSSWVNLCQLPLLPEEILMDDDLKILNQTFDHLKEPHEKTYLEAYKYVFSRNEDWTGGLNYLRTLPYWRLPPEDHSIQIPTLLVVGNADSSYDIQSVVQSSDYCQKFTLKVIAGGTHYLHQQKPLEVNKVIVNFLVGSTSAPVDTQKPAQGGLVNRVFGAVTSTVKYSNSVFDAVQKRTNGFTPRALSLGNQS